MASMEEIKENVENNGNVLTLSMKELRDACGFKKLGSDVCKKIAQNLADIGLGHVPKELPNSQDEPVRLYTRNTKVGQLIERVVSPNKQHDLTLLENFGTQGSDSDKIIKQNKEYAATIQKIRELVAD